MLDRQRLDSAKFIHSNGEVISIDDLAKKNNIHPETFKDRVVQMILDGIIIYCGKDIDNYPILKMK